MREQEGEERGAGVCGGGREGEGPAYHARRPMNAFLIFCKRHRAVVRDKYPNLENRSITKILGEWWANLDEDEKCCYTGLAKQYKDAFFNANPDFKWYKLPAPPLRTLNTPRHASPPSPQSPPPPDSPELRTNNNSTRFDYNKRKHLEEPPLSNMFTPGKLADEAHMGGLSSLLTADKQENYHFQYPENQYTQRAYERPKSKEDSIRELQNALTETTRMFENFDENPKFIDNAKSEDFTGKNVTNQEIIDQVVDRGMKDEKAEWADGDCVSRTGRSCKGKRYQEFMAVGGLLTNKRSRQNDWDGRADGSCSPDNISENGSPQKLERSMSPEERPESTESEEVKPFRPADFDLDAKIAALPSLSLEKFQQRKRENKKKKRSAFGMKPRESPLPVLTKKHYREVEKWREGVIGSQKRKPRKISITRLEVNSMVNRMEDFQHTPQMKIATEAPPHEHKPQTTQHPIQAPPAIDLLALATLAEVAANTSKMEEYPTTYQYHV